MEDLDSGFVVILLVLVLGFGLWLGASVGSGYTLRKSARIGWYEIDDNVYRVIPAEVKASVQ